MRVFIYRGYRSCHPASQRFLYPWQPPSEPFIVFAPHTGTPRSHATCRGVKLSTALSITSRRPAIRAIHPLAHAAPLAVCPWYKAPLSGCCMMWCVIIPQQFCVQTDVGLSHVLLFRLVPVKLPNRKSVGSLCSWFLYAWCDYVVFLRCYPKFRWVFLWCFGRHGIVRERLLKQSANKTGAHLKIKRAVEWEVRGTAWNARLQLKSGSSGADYVQLWSRSCLGPTLKLEGKLRDSVWRTVPLN